MNTNYNKKYSGEQLNHTAFPIGGLGAGMFCLQGTGGLGSFSLKNKPDTNNNPMSIAALDIKGEETPHVIEGPVSKHRILSDPSLDNTGNGIRDRNYGLPRFENCEFRQRFPFAEVALSDKKIPFDVKITGFSPFIPNDADNSSLPFGSLEYTFTNNSSDKKDAVFSFSMYNFLSVNKDAAVEPAENGFLLSQPAEEDKPHIESKLLICAGESAIVDTLSFRGGWFDTYTMLWNNIIRGKYENRSHKDPKDSKYGSLAVSFSLNPGESKTIPLFFVWYCPCTDIRKGGADNEKCCEDGCDCGESKPVNYVPWYAEKFASVNAVYDYVKINYSMLKSESKKFSGAIFKVTLPEEVIDAVTSNLAILKSPTVLRQTDGRLWCFEGCCEQFGCCDGTCTHVWNYAQAICNLFPELERGLRQTEYFESMDARGHQNFRAALPIRETSHGYHAASDGQLGGIIKVYRDWRISGDTEWLRSMWRAVKQSMDYCINTWDKKHEGVLLEPHHNTYDIEFWGADVMCSSFYLGALKSYAEMAKAMNDDCSLQESLYEKGKKYVEQDLFNGEYFYQKVQWTGLFADFDYSKEPEECQELLKAEGPKYQYGTGCISDGVLGAWMSEISGIENILDEEKVTSHLKSIFKYNFKDDLSQHSNTQRTGYALGEEGGLLLCSWPNGGKPSLPFVYSDEVWTGIEYQVASHLILKGLVDEGIKIVETLRARYDGTKRNPFDEYECGHWYARALASYALLQSLTGIRYDAVTKTLYIKPQIKGDFTGFLCTASGYANVGIKDGKVFTDIITGTLVIDKIISE